MKPRNFLLAVVVALVALSASALIIEHGKNDYKELLLSYEKGSSYEEIWKKVEDFEKKGLPQSALEVVEAIYHQAKIDSNYPQIVKSLIYKQKYKFSLEENAYQKMVDELKTEIDSARFPLKPVLHSVLADIYWSYYQYNRWQIYYRSETVGYNPEDINTWDATKILEACRENHMLAISNIDSLKVVKLEMYDDILTKQIDSKKYRPTLYDFLAHRAVDFFVNAEAEINKPASFFSFDQKAYFSTPEDFITSNIIADDSLSLKYNAMLILQNLEKFHSRDTAPDALIDVFLKRIRIVYNQSNMPDKDSLYLSALEQMEKRYNRIDASADISYKIAIYYENQAAQYQPLVSDDHKWDLKKAVEIAENTIEKHPGSLGAINCKYLVKRVKNTTASFTVESYNLPNQPFRAFVNYKNAEKLFFKVIKINWQKHRKDIYGLYGEDLLKFFKKLKPDKEFQIELKCDGDFQLHTTEIEMPSLENGYYLLISYCNPDYNGDSTDISYGYTQITNLAYLDRKDTDENYDIFVTNRESGKPLKGVKTILWKEKYDYVLQRHKMSRVKTYTTDEDGYFHVPATSEYGSSYYLEFINDDDDTYSREAIYQYKPYKYENNTNVTYFFTDREIYRPGQTVYFKGIMMKKTGDKHEILENYSTIVYFYDVNYQVISQVSLTSNEFGTFSGSFVIPQGILNGQMSLNNYTGSKYFYVEEYKRPKFEVSFNPIKSGFKLNQEIKITGKAVSYSGVKVDGAKVRYEVKRAVYYPYRWSWFYYWYYPQPEAVIVATGNSKTNDKGEFEISFTAEPDPSVGRKYKPAFTYTITADVTDINGETRSVVKSINVGYNALMISSDWEETVNMSETKALNIETTNLSGEFIPATGTVKIYKLKENEKLYRDRLWSEPDVKMINKEDYAKKFPYDYYSNEYDISKLSKETKVLEKQFNTEISKEIILPNLKTWKQGLYKIEVSSKDEFGQDMEYEQYVKLYSPENQDVAVNEIGWFAAVKTKCEPGEKATFLIGSADKDVSVLYEIEHKDKIVHKEWLTISKGQKLIEIPVTEDDRGNFAVHFMFVKHGRCYIYNELVTVPYSNKELDIQFETFRNKLYPGQNEEWKIKIKGPKGEKVAAEMMATLYDASLNQFQPNSWVFDIYKNYYSSLNWYESSSFASSASSLLQMYYKDFYYDQPHYYDCLNWFGFYYVPYYYNTDSRNVVRGGYVMDEMAVSGYREEEYDGVMKEAESTVVSKSKGDAPAPPMSATGKKELPQNQASAGEKIDNDKDRGLVDIAGRVNTEGVQIRKNFSETAFFYPQLETNEDGEVIIKFTVPEALTKWKMMGFAHTQNLMYGFIDNELITQKDLMIVPNMPRFLRENDEIVVIAKVSNLTDKKQSGFAQLELFDAITMKSVSKLFDLTGKAQEFSVDGNKSTSVSWKLKVPEGIQAVTYRFVAKTSKFSDGEENTIPVLTNRMLVTESMPLPIRGHESKMFKFEKLLNSGKSNTMKNERYTLEFTANPAWYAVQSLPYLIEYPYECAEQIFSRYYSNSIASNIANSSPKIKQVFDNWKNTEGSEALMSNLEKNRELKSLFLEETPWVLDAQDESERKRRVGLLFDLNNMANNINSARRKLQNLQCSNGGWVWFKGGPDDRYITQHIITGFGHLDHLGVKDVRSDNKVWNMVYKGIEYLDKQLRKDYNWLKKNLTEAEMKKDNISYYQIQYLYSRSYFKDVPIPNSSREAFEYFKGQAQKFWLNKNNYMKGMIALALDRYDDKKTPAKIVASLSEYALVSDEMGMYWKDNTGGYYWYQAPIETQALMIEMYDEVAMDTKKVDDLKVWLLKQKQTQDWKTTKATTEAVYALLLRGTDWLATESNVKIWVANQLIDKQAFPEMKAEAGTGYFKVAWTKNEIKPEMGEIKVEKSDDGVSWGAVYWQYFEQLDKITPHETPLKINKKLFKQVQTDEGKVLKLITDKDKLKIGDKVMVRIEIKVDRRMEYVHMKDMRASCFEPVNVLSRYKYQDGLGYYESTKDASTNFFFTVLNKGTYVFEYPLWVSHKGNFSNGITTIQCMYAPEFTSHSEGIRVKVD